MGVFAAAGGPLRSAVQAAMAERHPRVEVATRRTGFDEAFPALRAGRLDAAYLPEPLPGELPGIRSATVTRQRRLLLVPSDHRLAGRDAVSIEETNGETFLTLAGAPPAAVDWWLVDPRADGSHEDLLDLCADGRGLGFASDFAVTNYLRPGVAFVGLSDVEDARTALCWRADERDPAVLAFVATVRAVADVRSS